jgi:enoyl-CoA hydratase
MGDYPFFAVERKPEKGVALLFFNRPEKLNAMNWPFWRDLPLVVDELEADPDVRVVLIAGRGKSFSVGIDLLEFFLNHTQTLTGATADAREALYRLILQMQEGFNRMTRGDNVYIAAIHRHCIGAGLDLSAACDLRVASCDALFSLRETRIAIVSDMGSLNRLPRIIGQGNVRMMALTGRDFTAEEARQMGLVNTLYEDRDALMAGATALAEEIAANPPAAVRGTKRILTYMEDHSVEDGLRYVAAWNAAFLNTPEIQEALTRAMQEKAARNPLSPA